MVTSLQSVSDERLVNFIRIELSFNYHVKYLC